MKLTKFRVKNYKSIIDSGYCSFADDLTILIGKNESGKSAMLEALRDFGKNVRSMSDEVYPLDGGTDDPSVEVHLQLTNDEIVRIQEEAQLKLTDEGLEYIRQNGMVVAKNGCGQYDYKEAYLKQLVANGQPEELTEETPQYSRIRTAQDKVTELMPGQNIPTLNLDADVPDIQLAAREIVKSVKQALSFVSDENIQHQIVESMRTILTETETLSGPRQRAKESFLDGVVQSLPMFIFFEEFANDLPFDININDVKQNRSVCDFARIAGLNLDRLLEIKDLQRRINMLNRHSAAISGDFLEYWGQNMVEMVVKPEGEKLIFGIKDCETTNFYKVKQRSKGFQWFLSFYLRLNAHAGENNVIVIDEPGMNLHARAQKEIIKILLSKITPRSQVIFSTHSPYFLDAKRLDRIRVVMKSPLDGTVIREDVRSSGIDEESLLPLTTAAGSSFVLSTPHRTEEVADEKPEPIEEPVPEPEPVVEPEEEEEAEVPEAKGRSFFSYLKR